MTNMHFDATYEEVAYDQGEQNNKLRSSKSMVGSKFVCMTFVSVFTVILVQGVVLYFVLKLPTRQQSLLLENILNSACNNKSSEFLKENAPISSKTSVNLFGITVDTLHLIRKIESTLTNYDKSTFGRAIRYRINDECLNGGLLSSQDSLYKVFTAKCDASPFQQWRRVETKLHVGSDLHYPKLGSSFIPCLDCFSALESCQLIVYSCNAYPAHMFYIRIFQRQIDFVKNRINFSIHNSQFSTQCLGSQYSEQYKTHVFYLQECIGSDYQSFYLPDLDFSKEINEIRKKLGPALWSLYY